mgnify:CR=1 FL=1
MKNKEVHTFYNFQFKHSAVRVTNHPEIQASHVADAPEIHPVMLYRWRQEIREGKIGTDLFFEINKSVPILVCTVFPIEDYISDKVFLSIEVPFYEATNCYSIGELRSIVGPR